MDFSVKVKALKGVFSRNSRTKTDQEMIAMPPEKVDLKGRTFENRNLNVSSPCDCVMM